MSSASSSLRAGYRFGPFALDLRSGDLSRNGRRIRLQEKARSLLVALAERPGEMVTRSELHDRLWPENTFVDFEEGLNAAMSKLREALGDNSQSPRYIETVRGRGYRFIANVDSINASLETAIDSLVESTDRNGDSPALEVAKLSANASLNMQPTGDTSFEEHLTQPFPSIRAWRRWRLIAAGATAFVLALAAGGYFYSHRAPKLTEKDTIVLCDFSNRTGNAIFDDALNTALAVSLRQSPFINVLPESDVAATLQLMSRPADTELTPEVARELCQRAGSKAFIAGSIGSLGSEYVLDLKAVNCQTGDTLAQVQTTAANKEKVLDALGRAASKLRRQLGESLTTVRSFNVPLAQATTSSLEALKALTLGSHIRNQNGEAAALPYFQRAVDLDPNFAMGYRSLSGVYLTLGETERGGDYLTKAFQLRQRASEPEKMTIAADYYSFVTGELDKAAESFKAEIEIYPRSTPAYEDLSATYASQGEYEKGAEIEKQASRLEPDNGFWYTQLSSFDLASQRFDEAMRNIHEAQQRKADSVILRENLYALAFFKTDSAAMMKQLEWFAGKPEYESFGLALASDTQAYGGRLREARDFARRAADSALRTDNREIAATDLSNSALQQAAFGYRAEALKVAAQALKVAPRNQGAEAEAALAFAFAGDTPRAAAFAQDLEKRFPLDTQIQSLWLPAIQAQLALNRKNPVGALNALPPSSSIEFGTLPFGTTTGLYWLYVRGEAYLAAGEGVAAAAEFQKIIDHGGLVVNCWTGALAHLGVARANALQSKTLKGADADAARGRALAAYREFFTLWKNADPDIPILNRAKAEYAKLL